MSEIPQEFLSELSKDTSAMQRFSGLPDAQKEDVLNRAAGAISAQELAHIVSRI